MEAYAIILAGGDGERLWPLSTPELPKQFVTLFGGKPLIKHAADRLRGLIPPERIFVVTADRLVDMTRKALPDIPVENIIGEPFRRDTAAAVAVACGLVKRSGGGDSIGCILTADHLMTPAAKFRSTLKAAIKAARMHDAVVTIGIEPDSPATRFGYIERGSKADVPGKVVFFDVKRFVEKPCLKMARRYLKSGRFYWNSGMFIWKATVLADAFASAAPDFVPLIEKVAASQNIDAFLSREYGRLRSISFDYAVMEKISGVLVAESSFSWDDVGSWLSLANHFPVGTAGNICLGDALVHDAADSIVIGQDGRLTALIGIKDMVVVNTAKATLVCPKSRIHEIRQLLKNKK